MIASSEQKRFWTKVDIRGDDECWPWTRATNREGYGQFRAQKGMIHAHRFALESAREEPLGKLRSLHSCDNPPCCNPAHLRAGTDMDNAVDRKNRGRVTSPVGEAHGKAKLSNEDVCAIFADIESGKALVRIASMYGVSASTICNIKKGRIWTHFKRGGPQ